MPPKPSPRIYFNLRSPYSWLTLHDLTTHHPDMTRILDWRPFWDPSPELEALLTAIGGRFIYTPMSREKHFYVLRDIRRLAEERGLRVTWPIDRSPRWEVAHLAYFVAAAAGVGSEFAMAASRARWEQGQNLSDPAVVAEIGAGIALEPDLLANAADDQAMAATGARALLDAYRDGVFGVPFFVHGREKFWGLDRLQAFVNSVRSEGTIETVDRTPDPDPELVAMASTDDGHAGGCG